jgi:glycerol-3-phosphate dehydrogenase (NAD(P)+)
MSVKLQKIGVVGAGSWGTALAILLERNGCEVTVWGHDAGALQVLQEHRENRAYLPGISLSKNIRFTPDLSGLSEAELILLVTPSSAMREVAARLSTIDLRKDAILLSCTKGVERGSGLRMSQI